MCFFQLLCNCHWLILYLSCQQVQRASGIISEQGFVGCTRAHLAAGLLWQHLSSISSPSQARFPFISSVRNEGQQEITATPQQGCVSALERKNPSIAAFNHLNIFHQTERLVGKFIVVAAFLQREGRCEGEKSLNGDSALTKEIHSDYLRDAREENTGDLTKRKRQEKNSLLYAQASTSISSFSMAGF